MNIKKTIIFILLLSISLSPLFSIEKEIKIAMILWRGITDAEKGFQEELIELGYKPDFTIINADQNRHDLATALRIDLTPNLENFDYIYSFGTTATTMTHLIVRNRIPLIFNNVIDPVEAGIAESMESAGRNISGISNKIPTALQIDKALQIVDINNLGFIYNSLEINSNIIKGEMEIIAENYNLNLIKISVVPTRNTLEEELEEIKNNAAQFDAIYLPSDSFLVSKADLLSEVFKAADIISIGALKEYVSAGVFMGLVPDYHKLGQYAASILDRCEKGENLEDIPIITDNNPQIIINRDTKFFFNISIPEDIYGNAVYIE